MLLSKLLITGALLALLALPAGALTASVSGTEVRVQYTEPDVNADGSPLTDLDHTTIYAGVEPALTVPATAPSGAGLIDQTFVIPVEPGTERDVPLSATATDTSGNESDHSSAVTVRLDRLAPSAPH